MANQRCPCGFVPPLCPTCHCHEKSEQLSANRFQTNLAVIGEEVGGWIIVARDLEHVHSKQPDCVLECKTCKTQRRLSMRYIRRVQKTEVGVPCYTCTPQVRAPRKRRPKKKKSLTYHQKWVSAQQSQGAR